jgi:hypothetical protein
MSRPIARIEDDEVDAEGNDMDAVLGHSVGIDDLTLR